jgi:hypothetical protein
MIDKTQTVPLLDSALTPSHWAILRHALGEPEVQISYPRDWYDIGLDGENNVSYPACLELEKWGFLKRRYTGSRYFYVTAAGVRLMENYELAKLREENERLKVENKKVWEAMSKFVNGGEVSVSEIVK